MINFIGPLIMLTGIASIIGIATGLIKKNRNILTTSLIVFAMIALIFIMEAFFIE